MFNLDYVRLSKGLESPAGLVTHREWIPTGDRYRKSTPFLLFFPLLIDMGRVASADDIRIKESIK